MKRLLLPLLVFSIPAAHATNYVECEHIRAVIVRTQYQREEALNDIKNTFRRKKVNEKYGVETCNLLKETGSIGRSFLDSSEFKSSEFNVNPAANVDECVEYRNSSIQTFNKEWNEHYISSTKIYDDIETRATKDFKKRGCYYL